MQSAETVSNGPAPGFVKHPGHEVTLEAGQTVSVVFGGTTVASSTKAIALHESNYPVRYYIPLADVAEGVLEATDHETYCPFKGTARYWSVSAGGAIAENAAWGYDTPYDECAPLAGHVAFYGDKMDTIQAG